MSSDVYRNQAGRRSWIRKAIAYTCWSSFAGVATGAALGAVGGFLPLEVRLAIGSVVAVSAIVVGGFGLFGYRLPLPQLDRETPQRWVFKGPLPWAMKNGLALGLGATSRIGFPLWYAVPVGALLLGSPVLGAAAYGTYGLVRALPAPLLLIVMRRSKRDLSGWLIGKYEAARVFAAGQMLFLGVVTAVVVGL